LAIFSFYVKHLHETSVLIDFAPKTVEFLYIRKKTFKFAKIISDEIYAGFTLISEFCYLYLSYPVMSFLCLLRLTGE
jgi:hypothetical protein